MSPVIIERLYFSVALLITFLAATRVLLVLRRHRATGASAQNALSLLVATDSPTLVYFWTSSCGQCKPQEREIERAKASLREAGESLTVRPVNALDNPELARTLHVFTVPTTVLLDAHGRVTAWNAGFAPARKILEQVKEAA